MIMIAKLTCGILEMPVSESIVITNMRTLCFDFTKSLSITEVIFRFKQAHKNLLTLLAKIRPKKRDLNGQLLEHSDLRFKNQFL